MIRIIGCTSDVIDDISEFIGSSSIADYNIMDIRGVPLYEIILSEKCALFYHPKEVIIQKSVEQSDRFALAYFRFQEVIIQ